MNVEEYLEHYGVLGMKWGVRKDRRAAKKRPSGSPESVKVSRSKSGKKIKTTGGKGHPPSPEAVKAAAVKQKARASGVQSLANDEIREATKRMNIEKNFREAAANYNPGMIKRGQAYIKELLGLQQSMDDVSKLINSAQGQFLIKQINEEAAKAKAEKTATKKKS